MKTTRRKQARRIPMAAAVVAAVAAGGLAVLPTSAGAASSQVKVSDQTIGKMGKVLVANGKALYVLAGGKSCTSACLAVWPALTVPSGVKGATAGSGIQKSKLGITTDSAGAQQVTYGGMPIYFFVGDSKGTVKGDLTDQFGKWTAVVVVKPKHSSSTSSGATTAGGGGVSF